MYVWQLILFENAQFKLCKGHDEPLAGKMFQEWNRKKPVNQIHFNISILQFSASVEAGEQKGKGKKKDDLGSRKVKIGVKRKRLFSLGNLEKYCGERNAFHF